MDQRFTKGPDNMNQVVSPSAPLAVVMPGTDGTHLKWRAGGRIQQRLKNFVHALCNSDIDTKVIFLNQTGENIILPCIEQNPELADNIVPVSIQKGYSTQKDSQQYIRTQRPMYFFCKNASIRNKVTSYILEKNFKYSGFVLRARGEIGLDIEERLRMEAQALRNSLKNTQERLDALEKRINDYIK